MTNQPLPTNKVAEDVESFINSSIMTVGLPAAEKALCTAYPFVSLPLVNWIVNKILQTALSAVAKQLETLAIFQTIDLQIAQEKTAAKNAAQNLGDAIKKGDTDAIKKASDDFDKAFASAGKFDGIAVPK